MKESELLHPIVLALQDFEEAVKKHEHRSLVDSELLRRQEVDRARQRVMDSVQELMHRGANQTVT